MSSCLWKHLITLTVIVGTQFPIRATIGAPLTQNNSNATGGNLSPFSNLELIILHNNDMHGRFEETGERSIKCNPEDKQKNLCFGGFARTAHEIRRYRTLAKKPGGTPVLYLNAGDTYTGTPWFALFKDNITATFLNLLKPDAMSLGNHEFDEGVNGLIPFLNSVTFPVLASNLNLTKTPELIGIQSLRKSIVLIVKGIKIGVIGYVTPDTKFLTYPNDIEYYPEIESINKEANFLKQMGIKIFIGLGHSGFNKDKEIAKLCTDLDLVIGGHTNTFLWNGKPPSVETPEGLYPTIVENVNGKKVPVVQAFAYTKYLGLLKVKFNDDGDLISWDGQPILLNSKIQQDPDVLELLDVYRPNITALEQDIVGYTRVDLEGRSKICRNMECNLGNMISDAMVHARMSSNQGNSIGWTDAAIAFIQGGGIRASISKDSGGAIRKTDLFSVLPFNNLLYMVEVNGKVIRRALERSASLIGSDSNGGFLQMSGVQVVYDESKPVGQKLIEVNVRCAKCDIPQYSKLNDTKMYKIILSAFILAGGDGYKWVDSADPLSQAIPIQYTELDAVTHYIKEKSPVYPQIEGRIQIIGFFKPSGSSGVKYSGILLISIVLLNKIFL